MLGVSVLGDLNTPATGQDSLGLAFWRIVISAGILAMVMSVVNVISVSCVVINLRMGGYTNNRVAIIEFHFHESWCRCQRTSCPGLRSSCTTQSCRAEWQPTVSSAGPEARGFAAHLYRAVPGEKTVLHAEHDSIPSEDLSSGELERCGVVQILQGFVGGRYPKPGTSSCNAIEP